jgi:branched-chain amino acid transport system ATP-binding protein
MPISEGLRRTKLLHTRKLTVRYEKAEAVRDASINVESKAIVTIIGANGAGKTTILRAVSGFVPVAAGAVEFDGRPIHTLTPPEIVGLGIAHVLEGRRLFPYMSVKDNLLMGAYTANDRKIIKERLDVVFNHFPRLRERSKQKAGSLSGGEQQMLAVGRALMAGPKLILMDEPSLGLSPILVNEIANIITELNQNEGVSVLLVEQNARMALSLATYVYVLETGKIVLEGEPKTLADDAHVKKAFLGGT